jgi:hypothetical protein
MNNNLKNFFFTILFGSVACLLLGMLAYGPAIYNIHNPRCVIMIYGISGSLLYSVDKYFGIRERVYAFLLVIIIMIITQGKTHYPVVYIRNIISCMPIQLAIIYYSIFNKKYPNLPLFARGAALVVIYPILYTSTMICWVFFRTILISSTLVQLLYFNMRFTIITSVGMVLGFDLYDKLRYKILAMF